MTDIAAATQTALTRIITERQTKGRVPGLVGAVARGGKLAWSGGVGSASLDRPGVAPTADTQYLIASHSKTFTAVTIMALRDEGKLSLDDTVEKLIPESKQAGITVRQMLSHVSGMQREPVGDVWDVMAFPDRAELIAGWNEAERIGKPHHRFHYSNLVYSVLGEIIARLDGRSWYESIQARILRPLEMRRTTVGMDGGPAASGYYVPPFSDVPVPEPLLSLGAMDACGGLASTAEDLKGTINPLDRNNYRGGQPLRDEAFVSELQTILDPTQAETLSAAAAAQPKAGDDRSMGNLPSMELEKMDQTVASAKKMTTGLKSMMEGMGGLQDLGPIMEQQRKAREAQRGEATGTPEE